MDIATRVKASRDLHGWNRSELARRAKLKPQTISRIERGESTEDKVAARTVCAIAEATGVEVIWLVTGQGAMCRAKTLSPDAEAVVELMGQMSESERESVRTFCAWTLDQRPRFRPSLSIVAHD